MIFYFTGTGNSLWVAKELSIIFGEPLISIADELRKETRELVYSLENGESVFLVYPVHSWGPAVPVMQFLSQWHLKGGKNSSIYSLSTCGDECGHTDKMIRKALRRRGLSLSAAYSIQMPNNYILLPGFDVDKKEVENRKLGQAPQQLKAIVESVKTHANSNADLYVRGPIPFLKSRLVYPLFARLAIQKNAFYATDNCIDCGLCATMCPTGTISLRADGRPQWAKGSCVQCLACIHYCPVRAIEYGKISLKKGRYHHPEMKKNRLDVLK